MIVIRIANELPGEMIRNRPAAESVLFQKSAFVGAIFFAFAGFIDFEVVAPAGEFESVVAKIRRHFAHPREGQVCPLPRKKRYFSCHVIPFRVSRLLSEIAAIGNFFYVTPLQATLTFSSSCRKVFIDAKLRKIFTVASQAFLPLSI